MKNLDDNIFEMGKEGGRKMKELESDGMRQKEEKIEKMKKTRKFEKKLKKNEKRKEKEREG